MCLRLVCCLACEVDTAALYLVQIMPGKWPWKVGCVVPRLSFCVQCMGLQVLVALHAWVLFSSLGMAAMVDRQSGYLLLSEDKAIGLLASRLLPDLRNEILHDFCWGCFVGFFEACVFLVFHGKAHDPLGQKCLLLSPYPGETAGVLPSTVTGQGSLVILMKETHFKRYNLGESCLGQRSKGGWDWELWCQ